MSHFRYAIVGAALVLGACAAQETPEMVRQFTQKMAQDAADCHTGLQAACQRYAEEQGVWQQEQVYWERRRAAAAASQMYLSTGAVLLNPPPAVVTPAPGPTSCRTSFIGNTASTQCF
jgi:hypothetical protein